MKLFLTIIVLTISLSTNATHWLTYFVYFETEYIQGPWSRIDILDNSGHKYLTPRAYEDLFGTEQADLVNMMLSRLKEEKPELYSWTYDLKFINDTVVLISNGPFEHPKSIKNEITATLTLNGFEAVAFNFSGMQEIWTLSDLTLPYFDLVEAEQVQTKSVAVSKVDSLVVLAANSSKVTNSTEENPLIFWLILSALINLGLIGSLIKKNK